MFFRVDKNPARGAAFQFNAIRFDSIRRQFREQQQQQQRQQQQQQYQQVRVKPIGLLL